MSKAADLVLTIEQVLNIQTALSFALRNAKELETVLFGFDDEWEGYATRTVGLIQMAVDLLDGIEFVE